MTGELIDHAAFDEAGAIQTAAGEIRRIALWLAAEASLEQLNLDS
jgi:hypothetical protein